MAMILLVLASCRSVSSVQEVRSSEVQKFRSEDTIVMRDSVYLHDSIIYRERIIHDTVYITKEVYRDRLEARGERQKAVRTDTVVVTEWREKVIEHPPEKYIPKFHKWCTGLFLAIIAGVILYYVLKIVIRYYLRK